MTGSDPEVMSFFLMSPGRGCRRPKTGVYCTFHFLEACSSQEEAVTWQEITSRDFKWPEVPPKWHHLIGSHLEVAVEARTLANTVHFNSYKAVKGRKLEYTVHFTSYKAVARRRRQSGDRKWHHVTWDRKWLGSDVIWLEVTWRWL